MDRVNAWSEKVVIPTYPVGAPDKNPMFLEKRVYQGSSGVVYPHAVIDKIYDEKVAAEYTAVYLENRYLKIMLLPEIGGRVQMALDKTNGYHFVYYNQVIKPALVGLAGPWISGGIEFNWPQHHRPSTFQPVDWRIEEHADGSATVWFAEIEKMFNTRALAGFTLHPGRAYLEINAQLSNRTSEPQTFLWWANPAVHVNDDYQSVFPPDVHAVMDHGKRAVSSFPIATGVYYKVNYAPGTDISRYKNIPAPTSYMAYHSDFDFMGDYDYGKQAGMIHVANHHIAPGKKQWTWGNGDFGKSWDRQLTDEDGPYIELMCGVYTDNQPDFTWLAPGEEKSFTQVFMPYQKIGPACNASKDVVLRLAIHGGQAEIGVYVSAPRAVTARLLVDGGLVFEHTADLAPEMALIESVALAEGTHARQLTLQALDEYGHELLSFTPPPPDDSPIPAPASAARPPEEIASSEELYLNGLHLEQYRHATYPPEPYYLEALHRDPLDARCNNAMGLLLYRRGKFSEAEDYFRAAIRRLTLRNPNPYDGEPYYNLGLALTMQGREREAFDAFYKAAWNAAWQDAAYFELGRLAGRMGREEEAAELLEHALQRNAGHHRARHLKIALLRRAGYITAARDEIARALQADRMEIGALWEDYLTTGEPAFERLMGGKAQNYGALALDYAAAGMYEEALGVLEQFPGRDLLLEYYRAWFLERSGQAQTAAAAYAAAAALPADYCFPNRLESVLALQSAMRANPADARAPYALGNFWYAHRRYEEAIECWERAARLAPAFPTTFRNLGLAYVNKRGDIERARAMYRTAHELDPSDARVFFELDQLEKKRNADPAERLTRLEARLDLVETRDDLTVEYLNLLLIAGRPERVQEILAGRVFHPWEGGEGKISSAYVNSLVALARRALAREACGEAVELLERARTYPHNLMEGKLPGALENHIDYYQGLAYSGLGQPERANERFTRATVGLSEPTSAMYYNDQPPHMIFYQGLALQKLGRAEEARAVFERLVRYGEEHLDDDVRMDYFAVSLPDFLVFDDDLNARNRVHCHYMQALGLLGLGRQAQAGEQFAALLRLNADHIGAHTHRNFE